MVERYCFLCLEIISSSYRIYEWLSKGNHILDLMNYQMRPIVVSSISWIKNKILISCHENVWSQSQSNHPPIPTTTHTRFELSNRIFKDWVNQWVTLISHILYIVDGHNC